MQRCEAIGLHVPYINYMHNYYSPYKKTLLSLPIYKLQYKRITHFITIDYSSISLVINTLLVFRDLWLHIDNSSPSSDVSIYCTTYIFHVKTGTIYSTAEQTHGAAILLFTFLKWQLKTTWPFMQIL